MSHSSKWPGVLLLAFLMLFVSLPAHAAAGDDATDPPAAGLKSAQPFNPEEGSVSPGNGLPGTSTGTSLAEVLLTTAVVVVLILLAGWGLKKYGRLTGIPMAGERMRVIAALPLKGPNSLYIVEVDGVEMLVGIADGQIGLLKELNPGAVPAENPPAGPQSGIESDTIEVNTDESKRKDFSESLKTSIQRQEMENQAKRSESLKDKLSGLIDKSKSLGDLD